MRTKIILLFSVLMCACYWMACEDIDQIGMGIQPGGDKIIVVDDYVFATGRTVKDSVIYASSVHGLLGNYRDADYGDITAGYLCQFRSSPELGFDPADSIVGNKVDSMRLVLKFTTYFGDSLAPMEATVYPLKKQLPLDFYVSTYPQESKNFLSEYYDKNSILGKRAYTARDLTISDSLNAANIATNYKIVSVNLPTELGQQFLAEYQKPNHGAYASNEAMTAFFPGVYVASTFGSGCLVNVAETEISIYYTRKFAANDSTAVRRSMLNVTQEVIQLNSYTGGNEQKLLTPNDDYMYLKTPTGVFSEITIPIDSIKQKMGSKKFSNVRVTIEAEPQPEDKKYVFPFPGTAAATSPVALTQNTTLTQSKLLLIAPDSLNTFLKDLRAADNTNIAYTTTFNTAKSAYVFNNISGVIQTAMDNYKEDSIPTHNLVLRLVPVTTKYNTSQDYYSYSTTNVDYDTSNYLAPSAVTLRKKNLKIEIIAVSQK